MAQPGRRSAEALQIATPAPVQRNVDPDGSLNAAELKVWFAVTSTKLAGWATADLAPTLESLCRCVAAERWLAGRLTELRAAVPLDEDRISQVMKAREREGRAAGSFSTKLRLTPQARYQSSTAAVMAKGQAPTGALKPWETRSYQ